MDNVRTHGSKDSTSKTKPAGAAEPVEWTTDEVVMQSAGETKEDGHPTPEVLAGWLAA